MELKHIIYGTDKKGIARITINRPEVRNALNTAVRQELRKVVEEIEKDKDIRVAIITGAGDTAFISGADLNDFKVATSVMIEEHASTLGQQLFTDIGNLRVPVIAQINGFCLGGGLELALCCDIRIASDRAKFGQAEINVGIITGGGSSQRLPRLVGLGRAKELIYTGRIIEATEAERIGLVNKVVPHERLQEEVQQLAETIADKSPLIISLSKKTINMGIHSEIAAGLAYEKANFALCFATEDHLEGMTAFLERRKPQFKGK